MPKIKNSYQGKQLVLELEFCDRSKSAMRDISPKTIQFLKLQRGRDVLCVGMAIAKNDSGYFRVRYLESGQLREADVPKQRILPLEQVRVIVRGDDQAEVIHDAIAWLEQERDRLKAEKVALEGCWIETGKVKGRQFRQAWWRSYEPMFESKRSRGQKVKTCYIGEEGSPEHQEAKRAKYRRDRLKEIDRQLQMLMEIAK
jgi:hypothetical protein